MAVTPIDNPMREYKDYSSRFSEGACEFFDDMVKRAGVSPEENATTVKQYNTLQAVADKAKRKVNGITFLKVLVIVLTVLAFLGAAIFLLLLITKESDVIARDIVFAVLCAAAGVGLIILIKKKINVMHATRTDEYNAAQKKADDTLSAAWKQMATLNSMFDWDMAHKLVSKAMPMFSFDRHFDADRFESMSNNFGYSHNNDANTSLCDIESGELYDFPFLVKRQQYFEMGKWTYNGQLSISWETVEYDSDGNSYTVHHSETLNASVTKPKPFYSFSTHLIYYSTAQQNLSFSREKTGEKDMSDRTAASLAKRGYKEAEKKAKRAVADGTGFTAMTNSEFEGLFRAFDRDNEVAFRAMFTPLAQKNMVELIKKCDDFDFIKNGCATLLISEGAQVWNRYCMPTLFQSYDLSTSRNAFMKFCTQYFERLFFDFAPILCIPEYNQQKPIAQTETTTKRHFTEDEAEAMANQFNLSVLANSNSATNAIMKARHVGNSEKSDLFEITAYSFSAHERVDYVAVYGGDGSWHDVPVYWTEYIPCSRTERLLLCAPDLPVAAFQAELSTGKLGQLINGCSYSAPVYINGLLAVPLGRNADTSALDSVL